MTNPYYLTIYHGEHRSIAYIIDVTKNEIIWSLGSDQDPFFHEAADYTLANLKKVKE